MIQVIAPDLILHLSGPFAACHSVVDTAPYNESCIYDLCATLPSEDLVCDSFQSYADACSSAGGTPGDWRAELPQCRKFCLGILQ